MRVKHEQSMENEWLPLVILSTNVMGFKYFGCLYVIVVPSVKGFGGSDLRKALGDWEGLIETLCLKQTTEAELQREGLLLEKEHQTDLFRITKPVSDFYQVPVMLVRVGL